MTIRSYDPKEITFNQFSCEKAPIDRFIKNKAKKACKRLEQKIFVATLNGSNSCVGFYALQVGSDSVPDFPKDKLRHLQNHVAFPAIHLSYLGVDVRYQRQGLGRYLLQDVFERVAAISDHAGFYALTLQSIDDQSTEFYRRIGFEPYTEGGTQPKMLYTIENILKLTRRI